MGESSVEVRVMGDYWELGIPERARFVDRSYLRLWLANDVEVLHNLRIPIQNGNIVQNTDQLTRHDRSSWNMYFVFLDRFNDGTKRITAE